MFHCVMHGHPPAVVVLLQSGPELRFEPEPGWTRPRFGPKFGASSGLDLQSGLRFSNCQIYFCLILASNNCRYKLQSHALVVAVATPSHASLYNTVARVCHHLDLKLAIPPFGTGIDYIILLQVLILFR